MLGFFKRKSKELKIEDNGDCKVIIFNGKVYFMCISDLYSLLQDAEIVGKEFMLKNDAGSWWYLKRNELEYSKHNFEGVSYIEFSDVKNILVELIRLYQRAKKKYSDNHYTIELDSLKEELAKSVYSGKGVEK